MIEIRKANGSTAFLAPAAIASIEESGASSKWHGIQAYVRTFDGRTIETSDTAESLVRAIRDALSGESND